ncbi:MAG: dynamin family protein, partial [Xenococcus sp. (in: cyanobacteria)]
MTLNASAPVEAPLAFKDGGKLRAWNFTIDDGAIVPGNSGSPVTIPGSKEVIGVAIIREGSQKVTVISVDAIRYLKRPDKVPEYLWSNLTNDEGSNHMADIFQKYKTAKKEVLNIYESYKNIAKNNVNLDLLETKISLVKEKKYTLVVAGEVKSGKSTFINALLGEMVLPTGILQNTSSIIEIFSNPKKIVQVEYDDGTYQEVEESSTNITEFLENVAAIQDKYREIPFQRLKKFLMKNNDYPIDNETINDFLEELYENYNDYNLSEEKFQELTKEYLNKYRDLKKIPIEIKLGFPLKKEFEEVRIVDTPGVNAIGGVQDITFDYLNEADAIIFLHSVDGAIESQSFQEFTTKVASTKSNEVMFLVLTKAGNRNSHEVKAKLKDVISRLGKGTLNPERITYFDSLLKIIADHAKEFETFESLMESYEKQTQDFEERLDDDNSNLLNEYLLWDTKLSLLGQLKYRKPKDENGISFRDFILERSNFNVVETKLSQFASKAPFAKLFERISVIKADYENQKQDYLERIDLLEKSNKPAEQFK